MNEFTFLKNQMDLVNDIIDFFLSKDLDEQYNVLIIQKLKELNPTNYKPWLDVGYLSKFDFLTWYLGDKPSISINGHAIDIVLRLLCQKNLLFELKWGTDFFVYQTNSALVDFFHKRDLIKNVLFGFNYSIAHFANSIFKIEHIDNQENHYIGTGFYFAVRDLEGKIYSFIITNKHVVENANKLHIYNQNDAEYSYTQIVTSDNFDLAAFILNEYLNVKCFNFNEEPEILEDIITLGFPSVPMTQASYLLCHKGEINAFVKDYQGVDHVLISAKTSSGNSGGPIIDVTGRLIGIVTKEFYNEADFISKGKLPYYAGIHSKDIRSFLNEEVIPKVIEKIGK